MFVSTALGHDSSGVLKVIVDGASWSSIHLSGESLHHGGRHPERRWYKRWYMSTRTTTTTIVTSTEPRNTRPFLPALVPLGD
jgi:hypothetical protein